MTCESRTHTSSGSSRTRCGISWRSCDDGYVHEPGGKQGLDWSRQGTSPHTISMSETSNKAVVSPSRTAAFAFGTG